MFFQVSQRPDSLDTPPADQQVSEGHDEKEVSGKSMELLDESDGRSRDMMSLEQYQQQQKMMEELNKKKKQMLAKALAER